MDKLFYDKPARHWKEALPLGNGITGAMIYGGKRTETLCINDTTLWSGYPKDGDNAESLAYLDRVRELIFDGKNYEADKLAESKLIGNYSESYMPLGKINLVFSDHIYPDYMRELDLTTAVHLTNSRYCTREAFVSYPDRIGVYHVLSKRKISLNIKLSSKLSSQIIVDDTINLVGQVPDYVAPNYLRLEKNPIQYSDFKGMAFGLRLHVDSDGDQYICGDTLRIEGATNITIRYATATGFISFDTMPSTDYLECIAKCKKTLENSVIYSYEQLKFRHIEDYQRLYNKHSFTLGEQSKLPTNKLVKQAKAKNISNALTELVYNYGKYMTIAGSRKGGQALNLQGLWNNSIRPPWSSNYTTNINAEMNYWGTSAVGLEECIEPYIDMIYQAMLRGKKTAKINYGCRGFACNHNVDIWRKTAPVQGDANYMLEPLCGVWLANELYEHFKYGKLDNYKDKIFEIVEQATLFCYDYLIEYEGKYVICPSASPENVFSKQGKNCKLDYASSFDMALVKQCLSNYLHIDDSSDLARNVAHRLENLYPFKEGQDGILEWHEYLPTPEMGHRHFSPLYAFYPARVISYYRDIAEREWVRKLFHTRLNNVAHYFGWSGAWAMCLSARLREKDTFKLVLDNMLSKAIFKNLFDVHPPFLFQIDGNFGYVAGINEAVASVDGGILELLPAVPNEWKRGKVDNMVLPTGHTISFEWEGQTVTKLDVIGDGVLAIYNQHICPSLAENKAFRLVDIVL